MRLGILVATCPLFALNLFGSGFDTYSCSMGPVGGPFNTNSAAYAFAQAGASDCVVGSPVYEGNNSYFLTAISGDQNNQANTFEQVYAGTSLYTEDIPQLPLTYSGCFKFSDNL